MLKSSAWIKDQAEKHGILDPFVPESVRKGVISYGLGPYGYDIRLDKTYKKIRPEIRVINPHLVADGDYETFCQEEIHLEAGATILGKSLEYFRMPKKVIGLVLGKSTYARTGVLVNVTPLEPEWSGFLTISISNLSGRTAILFPLQGIAQVIFFESDALPLFSYRELKGKYNDQQDILPAKIRSF
jgi:dCTP deaminase